MDQEIINGINTVIYYYEQYKNGNEEALIALETIAKGIKKETKERKKYYFLFSTLTIIERIKIAIFDITNIYNEDYNNLINMCKDDINYYNEISKTLEKYAKYALRTKDYEYIDDVFILSVKVSTILSNISEYYKQINIMLSYTYSSLTYVYPDNIKTLSKTTRTEIDNLLTKIDKKDS